ncbi:MAG: hypothetical protein VB142_07450 [Burkholderia sp.]
MSSSARPRASRSTIADSHSPWQRGRSNENPNGLLRQYMPKGTDLAVFFQAELDDIVWQMNTRTPARARAWTGRVRPTVHARIVRCSSASS